MKTTVHFYHGNELLKATPFWKLTKESLLHEASRALSERRDCHVYPETLKLTINGQSLEDFYLVEGTDLDVYISESMDVDNEDSRSSINRKRGLNEDLMSGGSSSRKRQKSGFEKRTEREISRMNKELEDSDTDSNSEMIYVKRSLGYELGSDFDSVDATDEYFKHCLLNFPFSSTTFGIDHEELERTLRQVLAHCYRNCVDPRVRKCINKIQIRVDSSDGRINITLGSTQLGKSEFIAHLSWVMSRMGFISVVFTMNKQGGSTMQTLEAKLETLDKAAQKSVNEWSDKTWKRSRTNVENFLQTKIIRREDSNTITTALRDDHLNHPTVVMLRQNVPAQDDVGSMLDWLQPSKGSFPIVLIHDEDDSKNSDYSTLNSAVQQKCYSLSLSLDGRYSKTHERLKKIIANRLELKSDVEKNGDFDDSTSETSEEYDDSEAITFDKLFENKTLRDGCKAVVSVSATGYAMLCQKYVINCPQYLTIIEESDFPDYHGYNVSGDWRIRQVSVPAVQSKTRNSDETVLQRHQNALNGVFTDAYRAQTSRGHSNVVIAGDYSTVIDMDSLSIDVCKTYAKQNQPFVSFSYHYQKNKFTILRDGDVKSDVNLDDLCQRINSECDKVKPGGVTVVESDGIATFTVDFIRKEKSSHALYDVAGIIHNAIWGGSQKQFLVCVTSAMADRLATFKDSNHHYYPTEMYVHVSRSAGWAFIIQKIGRLCGKDNDGHVGRTLYASKETLSNVRHALNFNKIFIDTLRKNPGKTFQHILESIHINSTHNELEFLRAIMFCTPHQQRHSKQLKPEVATIVEHDPSLDFPVGCSREPNWRIEGEPAETFVERKLQREDFDWKIETPSLTSQQSRFIIDEDGRKLPDVKDGSRKFVVDTVLWNYYGGGPLSEADIVNHLKEDGWWHDEEEGILPDPEVEKYLHYHYRKVKANVSDPEERSIRMQLMDGEKTRPGIFIVENGSKRLYRLTEKRFAQYDAFNGKRRVSTRDTQSQRRAVWILAKELNGFIKPLEYIEELHRRGLFIPFNVGFKPMGLSPAHFVIKRTEKDQDIEVSIAQAARQLSGYLTKDHVNFERTGSPKQYWYKAKSSSFQPVGKKE